MEPKPKPTYRKAGLAIGFGGMLYVMKPATILELAVVGAIWSIAMVAILTQWNLDKSKGKNSETNNIDLNGPGGNVTELQPGTNDGAVPGSDGSDGD